MDNILNETAAEIALAFQGTREKVAVEHLIDENGKIITGFPKSVETVSSKTVAEIAETETLITFLSSNGLFCERPLTFLEILEKMVKLGFVIHKST